MNLRYVICSEIIDVRDGTHDSPKYIIDGGYPLITSKNINNNKIDFSNVNYISEEDYIKINQRSEVSSGDIIMPMIGTIGNPVIIDTDKKFAIKNVALFKLANNETILSKYFYYILKTQDIKRQLESNKRGGTQNFVSLKNIRDLKIPLIDILEQKKIVEILDKAQELIDKRKEQIKYLDELVKSQFIEMFGDPFNDEKGFGINKLGEVTVVNPKKAEIKDLDKKLLVSFVPMDRVGEKGEFNPEVSKSIGEVYSGFTYFRENDVLFAKITPCMENGKGAVAVNLSNGIGFGSTEFHVLRPLREKSNSYWIYYLTTLIEFRRLAERKMTGSAGQKRVPTDFLNNIRVVVPPIELQNKFVQFTKQVDKLKFEMEKSLKELEDNFNALMQRAFKGELFS